MTCTNCTADVTNGLALCERCTRTLREALVNAAAYYGDVSAIQPGQRVKVRSAYRSTPPPAVLPSADPISDALDHTDAIVVGWVRNLQDDRPGIDKPPTTVVRAMGWLEGHVSSIVTLSWANEILREMLECERMLKRIVDKADTGWYAGPCRNEVGRTIDEDGLAVSLLCPRELYGSQSSSWVRCPECGRQWDAGERRENLMREARDEVAPVSTIARACVGLLDTETSVERLANRIDRWVSRERLKSMGVRVLADGKPHRVYRIGDVFDLLGVDASKDEAEAC